MAGSFKPDFVISEGLEVQGANVVTSSTNNDGAGQFNGGLAVAKNLIVGTTATIHGAVTINGSTTITNTLLVLNTATFDTDIIVTGNLGVSGNIDFSSLGVTGQLQAGSLVINTTSSFLGTATFYSDIIVTTGGNLTVQGPVVFSNTTTAASNGSGAVKVVGGLYLGDNLYVAGTQTSLAITASNSIFTLGGVGISKDLLVGGDVLVVGNFRVQGTQTIIDSTSTTIQDPVVDIGTGLANAPLGGADGLNKGIVIHYYDLGDNHMFLGRSNSSGRLVVRDNIDGGMVDVPNTDLTTEGSYSGFDIGDVKIWNTTTATSTNTGALQVIGGIGVNESIYVANNVDSNSLLARNLTQGRLVYSTSSGRLANLPSGTAGQVLLSNGTNPYWGSVSASTIDFSVTATNIRYGYNGAIPYQVDVGKTGFSNNLSWNSGTNTLNIYNLVASSPDNSFSTSTGALVVTGGGGIGKDLWVGGNLYVAQTATIDSLVITNTLSGITLYSVTVQGTSTFNTIVINGLTQVGNLTGGDTTVTNLTVLGQTDLLNGLSVLGATSLNTFTANVGTVSNFFSTEINTQYITITGDATVDNSLTVGGTSTFRSTVTITTTTNSTGTDSGALVVAGGVGIGGSLYVGGNAYAGGALLLTTATVNEYASKTVIIAGTDTAVNTSTGNITIWNTSNLQSVTNRGSTSNNIIILNNGSNSTSTDSGTLVVDGGVGISGNLYIGGNGFIGGDQIVTSSTVNAFANQTNITAGTDTAVSTSTGNITIWNTSTLQTVTGRGSTTTNAITISNATSATDTETGALVVTGGVGIGGNLYVGSDTYIAGAIALTSATVNIYASKTVITAGDGISVNTSTGNITISNTGVLTLAAGTDTAINTATGAVTIWNLSTLQSVTNRGSQTSNALRLTNTTDSSSTETGALIISGGVGVGGSLWASQLYDNGSRVLTQATLGSYGVSTVSAGTDTAVNTSTGNITVWNTSTLQTVTGRGATTDQAISITNAAASTTTLASNALYIAGGVGIGSSLYVTGPAVFSNNVIFNGTATYVFSTNTVYTDNILELHYPLTDGNRWLVDDGKDIGFRFHYYNRSLGTDTNAGLVLANDSQWLEWYGSGVEDTTSTFSGAYGSFKTGSIALTNTTASANTTTGALTVAGGVGIGGDLNVGGNAYAGGSLLLTTATVNQFASKTTIIAGTDTAVNTSTGNVTIWNTSTLQSVTDRGATTPNAITITNTTNASSTITGALVVSGGVGIGGSLYVGNTSYVAGAQILTTATVNQYANQTFIYAGTGIAVNTNTGNVTVTNVGVTKLNSGTDISLSDTTGSVTVNVTSTLQSVTNRGTTTTNAVHITNTTSSTSTTTGALVVDGGIAAGGNVTVGSSLNISQFFTMFYNTATQSVDFVFN
jgi:hypothetical protein